MRHVLATAAALLTVLGMGNGQTKARADEPTDLVQNWYLRYLGRPLDASGLNNWVGYLYRGVSPDFVQVGILASDEYYYRHGSTPEGFITGLYVDVLGRAPTSQELYPWVWRLQRFGSRQQIASEFLDAARPELTRGPLTVQPSLYVPPPATVPPVIVYSGTSFGRVYRPYGYRPYYPGRFIRAPFGYYRW